MKKLILAIIFLIITSTLFAENFDLAGCGYWGGSPEPFYITFKKNNKLKIKWYQNNNKEMTSKTYSYKKEYIGRIPMIVLNEDMPKDLRRDYDTDDNTYYGNKFMLLTGIYGKKGCLGLLLLPRRKNEKACNFFNSFGEYWPPNYSNASSSLKENNKHHKIDNLAYPYPEEAWVEGVDGWGIGESFVIGNSHNKNLNHILLMNGYISAKNPHLYEQNGRIKKIEVKGVKSGKKKNFIVKDTPHPQTIDISFLSEPEDVKITILDVYKGTKYQDTAIHFMAYWYEKVIPWE